MPALHSAPQKRVGACERERYGHWGCGYVRPLVAAYPYVQEDSVSAASVLAQGWAPQLPDTAQEWILFYLLCLVCPQPFTLALCRWEGWMPPLSFSTRQRGQATRPRVQRKSALELGFKPRLLSLTQATRRHSALSLSTRSAELPSRTGRMFLPFSPFSPFGPLGPWGPGGPIGPASPGRTRETCLHFIMIILQVNPQLLAARSGLGREGQGREGH